MGAGVGGRLPTHGPFLILRKLAPQRALRGRLSGLAQPTYVLDIPGGHGKSPIGPTYLSGGPEGYAVRDWQGISHRYRDRVRHKKKQP